MKNKEKYDLTKLEISVGRRISGCGRAIPNPIYVNLTYDGQQILQNQETTQTAFKYVMEWLENEA